LGGNAAYSLIAQVYGVVISIISIPILVHGLGLSAFGLYMLSNVLTSYWLFLDLGLTTTLIWAVAKHHARRDKEGLEKIIGTAFTVMTGLGLVAGSALALLVILGIDRFLHLPAALVADARFVLGLTAVSLASNLSMAVFYCVPQGLQRLDLTAKRNVVLATLSTAGQIAAIQLGGGLRWVVGIGVGVNLLGLVAFMLVTRHLLPGCSIRPRLDRWAVRELAGFSSMKLIGQICTQIVFQLDRVILAAFLPIEALAFYSVPLSIAQRLIFLQSAVGGAFFPAAAAMHHSHEPDRVRELYLHALKLVSIVILPIVVLMALLGHPVLELWLGTAFADRSSDILTLLAIAFGATSIFGVSALAADATGHVRLTSAFAVISAAINLSLTLLLVPRLGAIGAAWALLANMGLQGGFFALLFQYRFLAVRAKDLLNTLARPALCVLALSALLVGVIAVAPGKVALVTAALVGTALYAALTVRLKVWSQHHLTTVSFPDKRSASPLVQPP
jgi:O-antigen/teichoic acid export membrane protein